MIGTAFAPTGLIPAYFWGNHGAFTGFRVTLTLAFEPSANKILLIGEASGRLPQTTFDVPVGTLPGDLLLAVGSGMSEPGGWTTLVSVGAARVFYREFPVGGPASYEFTSSERLGRLFVLRNVAATAPIVHTANYGSGGGPFLSPSITTVVADCYVMAHYFWSGLSSISYDPAVTSVYVRKTGGWEQFNRSGYGRDTIHVVQASHMAVSQQDGSRHDAPILIPQADGTARHVNVWVPNPIGNPVIVNPRDVSGSPYPPPS